MPVWFKVADVLASFHEAAPVHGVPASLLTDNGAVFTAAPAVHALGARVRQAGDQRHQLPSLSPPDLRQGGAVLLAAGIPRSSRLLRPPASRRQDVSPGDSITRQPLGRDLARRPGAPHPLRCEPCVAEADRDCRLTSCDRGMSSPEDIHSGSGADPVWGDRIVLGRCVVHIARALRED